MPVEQTSAYLRLLDPDLGLEAGTPLGHRVCQDIGKFIPALKAIRDHRGVTVPDLGTRKGHRALAAQGKAQRGGKREKGAPSNDIWVHPDAAQARLGLNAASLERHKKSTQKAHGNARKTQPFTGALWALKPAQVGGAIATQRVEQRLSTPSPTPSHK